MSEVLVLPYCRNGHLKSKDTLKITSQGVVVCLLCRRESQKRCRELNKRIDEKRMEALKNAKDYTER